MNQLPARLRILALASDITMPTARIAAAVGVSRQRVHFVLMRDAHRLLALRVAAGPRVNRARDAETTCERCARTFRHRATHRRRFCSPACWYSLLRLTNPQ